MISHWILAARIKTLPVSLCPVVLAISISRQPASMWVIYAILVCVLCIQIGTNFFNDYYDYKKGADSNDRVGPKRMTQSGCISPQTMFKAAILMFGLAFISGSYLIYIGGWPILIIGLVSLLCGYLYTATPYAFAYNGGAELITYLFFGPVSVMGTAYLLTGQWVPSLAWIGSGIGCITSAILVVNNTRDIDTDRVAGKKTFSVRFGRTFSYIEYILMLYTPIFILDFLTEDSGIQMALVLLLVFFALLLTKRFGKANLAQFNRLLGLTSLFLILYTVIAIYLLTL